MIMYAVYQIAHMTWQLREKYYEASEAGIEGTIHTNSS